MTEVQFEAFMAALKAANEEREQTNRLLSDMVTFLEGIQAALGGLASQR